MSSQNESSVSLSCKNLFALIYSKNKSSIDWSRILKLYVFVSPKLFLDQAWRWVLDQEMKEIGEIFSN